MNYDIFRITRTRQDWVEKSLLANEEMKRLKSKLATLIETSINPDGVKLSAKAITISEWPLKDCS